MAVDGITMRKKESNGSVTIVLMLNTRTLKLGITVLDQVIIIINRIIAWALVVVTTRTAIENF